MQKYVEFIKKLSSFRFKRRDNSPPIFIYIFGGLFVLMAFININAGLNDQDKGFSFVNEVLASVRIINNLPAPNQNEIVSNLYSGIGIADNDARCDLIDPNYEEIRQVYMYDFEEELNKDTGGFLGFNQGEQDNVSDPTLAKTLEFDGGFTLAIFTEPSDVQNAIGFIKKSTDNDLIPIVRLCFAANEDGTDNCDFKSADSIINFYREIESGVDNDFVGIIGPNEPGSGEPELEMEGFGFSPGDYGALIDQTNQIAQDLQDIRAPGGNMFIAPAALNITNVSALGNDVKAYTAGTLQDELYDYILANTYEYDNTKTAYGWYQNSTDEDSLKNYIDNSSNEDLKVILSEFGIHRELSSLPDSVLKERAKVSFAEFCADERIDGVMFFRALTGLDSTEEKHILSDDEIRDIISDCSRERQPDRDWAWGNCNFDSLLYEHDYPANSGAVACGTESIDSQTDSGGGATLRLWCAGDPCEIRRIDTYEISMPIKHFGSNSSAGTSRNEFNPICAQVAKLTSSLNNNENLPEDFVSVDALNQFAGVIGTDFNDFPEYEEYPMPWLGSAINCSAELIKLFDSQNNDKNLNLHPGSDIRETRAEARAEIQDETIIDSEDGRIASTSLSLDGLLDGSILDERAYCTFNPEEGFDLSCFDKAVSSSNLENTREYNPLDDDYEFTSPQACSETELKIRQNPNSYITGPELTFDDEVERIPVARPYEVCWAYGTRNTDNADPNFEFYFDIECNAAEEPVNGYNCPAYQGLFEGDDSPFQQGELVDANMPEDVRRSCLQLDWSDATQAFYRVSDYEPAPEELEIEGIYDSLYQMYTKLQRDLDRLGQKIVFKENIGWEVFYRSKIRDASRSVSEETIVSLEIPDAAGEDLAIPYKYAQEPVYESESESFPIPEERRGQLPENIWDNKNYLARGQAYKETAYYYDWLGYLDIMQEWMIVYLNNDIADDILIEPSPYVDDEDAPEALRKERLSKTGGANLLTSFPIPTCDEIEERKYLGEIDEDIERTCITTADDDTYEDELAVFLCEEGYTVEGECGVADVYPSLFCEAPDPTDPGTPGENPPDDLVDPSEFSLIYPSDSTRVSAPYGVPRPGYTHAGVDFGLPLESRIYAAAPGKVIAAGPDNENPSGAYGQFVKIQHANGYVTVYAHNTRVVVEVDQQVSQGQVIAFSGNTGNSSNPHLHFELRRRNCLWDGGSNFGSCTTDPMPYITGKVDPDDVIDPVNGEDDSDVTGPIICQEPNRDIDYKTGALSCSIDVNDVTDIVNFDENIRQIEARVESYNLDNNQSYTWLANLWNSEDDNSKIIDGYIDKLGSREAYEQDFQQRRDMTEKFLQAAIDNNINPRFAFALWVEETAGSAIGGHALGCGVNTLPEIPYGGSFDDHFNHLKEQLACLKGIIDKTSDFEQFMCTYSGDRPLDSKLDPQPFCSGGGSSNPFDDDFRGTVQSNGVRDCDTQNFVCNPNFPVNLCKYYNYEPI